MTDSEALTEALLPCPLCGEVLEIRSGANPYGRHPKDSECFLGQQAVNIPHDIERWNRRAALSALGTAPAEPPQGMEEPYWSELVTMLVKETERTCGPGPAVDAVKLRLASPAPATATEIMAKALEEAAKIVETALRADYEKKTGLTRDLSEAEMFLAAAIRSLKTTTPVGVPEGWPINLDIVSSAQFVARVQSDALTTIAVPMIEELSKRPGTVWGEIIKAVKAKAAELWDDASPAPATAATVDAAWQELIERDDRTSPEEYPDMALITKDELATFMSRAPANAAEIRADEERLRTMRDALVYGMKRSTRDWRKPDKQEAAHDMAEQLLSVFDAIFPALSEATANGK